MNDVAHVVSSNVQTSWTVDQIVDALEEDIIFGFLSPRERLVEDNLCERFKTTRHTIRQALMQLETAGLIVRRRNIGAMVKSYTAREVMELYAAREALETHAASKIDFPVSDEQIQALKDIQAQHDVATKNHNMRAAFRANIIFHQTLFKLANNQVFSELIDDLARRAHVIRFQSMVDPSSLERARQDHWKIIHALEQQDRKALVAVCADHLLPSRDRYLMKYRTLSSGLLQEE